MFWPNLNKPFCLAKFVMDHGVVLHGADDPVVEEGEEGDGDDAHHPGVDAQDGHGIGWLHPQLCQAHLSYALTRGHS